MERELFAFLDQEVIRYLMDIYNHEAMTIDEMKHIKETIRFLENRRTRRKK